MKEKHTFQSVASNWAFTPVSEVQSFRRENVKKQTKNWEHEKSKL